MQTYESEDDADIHDDHASAEMIPNQNVRSREWDVENIVEKVRAIHRSRLVPPFTEQCVINISSLFVLGDIWYARRDTERQKIAKRIHEAG